MRWGGWLARRSSGAPSPRLALVVMLGLLVLALAQTAAADPLDDRARAIAKQLQCPVCQSVSVADSPSELAGQMRDIIRTKLEEGWSEEQIKQYFIDRYGEQVLVEPPRHGLGLAVWWAPVAILAGGAALLLALLRSWLKPSRAAQPAARGASPPSDVRPPTSSQHPSPNGATRPSALSYDERARLELERFRREVDR